MKWAYRAKVLLWCIIHFLKMKLQIPKSISHPLIQINASPKLCFVRYHFLIAKYTKYVPKLVIASTYYIHFKKWLFRLLYNKGITKNTIRICNAPPNTGETHFVFTPTAVQGVPTVFLKKRYQSTASFLGGEFSWICFWVFFHRVSVKCAVSMIKQHLASLSAGGVQQAGFSLQLLLLPSL